MIRRFASRFLVLALTKGKQDFLAKQYKLDPQVIEAIAEYDPSPNNAYTAWLCKVYKEEGEDLKVLETLRDPITKFMKLINSPDFPQDKRDIGKYNAQSLIEMVGSDRKFRRQLSQTEIERQIMNEGLPGARLIWNSDNFKMWHVTNINYAMFLGSNTKWCTAQPHHARQYCASGGLFPVYYKGKPFCQGHINQQSGGVTFLNKEDRDVDITDVTFLTFLEVVDTPEVRAFANHVLSGSALHQKIRELGHDSDPKIKAMVEHFKSMALKFRNAQGIAYILQGLFPSGQLWPEGVEFLLDYPSVLLPAMADAPPQIMDELKTKYPELVEELVYEVEEAGKYLGTSETVKLMTTLATDPTVIENYLDENMSNIDLDNENWPELISIFTKKVEALNPADESLDLNKIYDFFNTNNYNDYLKDAAMIFWRKFIRTRWEQLENVIEEEPEYKAAIDSQRTYLKAPKGDTIVTTTAMYKGANQGETGTIISVENPTLKVFGVDEEAYIVKVLWNNGVEEEMTIFPGMGDTLYLQKKMSGIAGWKIDPDQTGLKVGDKVVPSSNWDGDADRVGQIATIVSTEDENENTDYPEGKPAVYVDVEWEDGTKGSNRGWYAYRFTRVIVSTTLGFPGLLTVGQKIKIGPTWTFGPQAGKDKVGIVKEDDHDGWFQVSWGDNEYASPYRYGTKAGGNEIPFRLDIMPVDIDFKLPKGSKYDWDDVDHESELGKKILELSANLAEEYGE